ncbi:MAG: hypothetical protein K5793_09750, partial [Nitrosarchaeum sp.]|nr:hypothetical protein [Nitrosarchaeum sp.]
MINKTSYFQIFTLLVILSLVSSPTAFADSSSEIKLTLTSFQENITSNISSEVHNKIKLHESISVKSNDSSAQQNFNHDALHIENIAMTKTLHLHENIAVESFDKKLDPVITTKPSFTNLAILDRITPKDKKSNLEYDDFISLHQFNDHVSKLNYDVLLQNLIISSVYRNDLASFDNVVYFSDLYSDFESDQISLLIPFVMLGFVSVAIFSSQRDEKHKLCFSFVVLLISSAFIAPLSISNNYYGLAFAQESFSNSTSPDLTNSTSPDLTNSTSPDLTNSTSPDLTNSTSPDLTNS